MVGLSPRQQEVYDFIEKYRNENEISPSVIDIADGLGLSSSTIFAYIGALKRKKRVTNLPGVPRSIRVIPLTMTLQT